MKTLHTRLERLEQMQAAQAKDVPTLTDAERTERIEALYAAGTLPPRVLELLEIARQRRDAARAAQ